MKKEVKMGNKNTASFVLGVIALSTCWLLSWISVILAIVGICLPKTEGKENRDITLNVLAIIIGILAAIFWISVAY